MEQYIPKSALVAEIRLEKLNLEIATKEGFITEFGRGQLECLDGLLSFIDTLEVKEVQEEPVSKDLEEAAEEWDESLYRSDAFKAGANWQKDKMMQNTIDAQCFGFQDDALFSFKLPADNYLVGSEVKVIVIKED